VTSRAHIWTQGNYKVKPGCADEFVRGWHELARHAVEEFGVAPPRILYDREDPSVYVTFGIWDSLDTLQRFRSSPLVAERASALDDLLDSAEARVLEQVAHTPSGVDAVEADEWDWSRTVVDHLDLHATDFSESVRFYETILAPLAIPKLYEREGAACFTHVNVVAQTPPTKQLHLCFYARSKEEVDAFHRLGVEAGFRSNGAPGYRDYAPGYYAAYLLDPDGNNVEALYRDVGNPGHAG
jgi:quinol monooxygenase YgiN/catechol 2,3-dioxygenase-like lactoylglutathione lyase family enzyme